MGLWSTLKSLFHNKSSSPSREPQEAGAFSLRNERTKIISAAGQDSVSTEVESLSILDAPLTQAHEFSLEEEEDLDDILEQLEQQRKIKEWRGGKDFVEQDLSPFFLSSFIGQEAIKQTLRRQIERVTNDPEQQFPHLLLNGRTEMGKRTLALAIVHEIGAGIISCDSSLLQKPGDLALILTHLEAGDILLLEAIESLNKELLSRLLVAMEEGILDLNVGQGPSRRSVRLAIHPFTLVGTTTKLTQVDQRLRRWLIVLNLAPYDLEQISELVMVLAEQQGLLILPEAARLLAEYCDGSVGSTRVLVKRVRNYARSLTAVTPEVAREVLTSFGYLNESAPSIDLEVKLQSMTGPDFEEFVATVFRRKGYAVEMTPGSGDHGIDLFLRKGSEFVAVQCKRWEAPVGEPVVRDFFGSMMNARAPLGFIITTSFFTTQAFDFSQGKPIRLFDLDTLVELIAQTEYFSGDS